MTELLDDLIAFFEARNTENATNELLNRCKEEKEKQLLIQDVVGSYKSKPYADLCNLRKEKIEDLRLLDKIIKDIDSGVGRYTKDPDKYKP